MDATINPKTKTYLIREGTFLYVLCDFRETTSEHITTAPIIFSADNLDSKTETISLDGNESWLAYTFQDDHLTYLNIDSDDVLELEYVPDGTSEEYVPDIRGRYNAF